MSIGSQVGQPLERRPVVRFILIAFLGPVLAGIGLRLFGATLSPLTSGLVIALAMPAPLLASVVVSGGWHVVSRDARRSFARPLLTLLLPGAAAVVWVVSSLVIAAGAAGIGVMGIEGITTTPQALAASLQSQLPASTPPPTDLPAPAVLLLIGVGAGLIAGLSINGLLAFGEEHGWRGFLWDRVARWGRFGTIGLVGMVWGLWHAPLILLAGLNYPDDPIRGVVVMTVFTLAASYPLDELRRCTGGAIGPAIFHGAVNGTAGVLAVLVVGNDLVTPPAGVIGGLSMIIAGAFVAVMARRFGSVVDSAAPLAGSDLRPADCPDGTRAPHRTN